jgi:hypothetical protein
METPILNELKERLSKLTPDDQKEVLKFLESIEAEAASASGSGLAGLWNEIDEIVSAVPEDAWSDVPTDGAANHDHYLYGSPKRY